MIVYYKDYIELMIRTFSIAFILMIFNLGVNRRGWGILLYVPHPGPRQAKSLYFPTEKVIYHLHKKCLLIIYKFKKSILFKYFEMEDFNI